MTTFAISPQTAATPGAINLGAPPDPNILAANLSALSRRNPRLAEAVLAAAPAPGIRFVMTDDGVLSADLGERALASRRRPLDEAKRLADTLEPANAGCAVVLGFGVGHHVRLLAERMEGVGVVACFEPDLELLRAVFERIDHSAWLAMGTTAIFHDADDRAGVTFGVQGWEAPLAVGAQIIEHAPSRPRLGDAAGRFAQTFSSVVGTVRTHVITTMMHADVTARNALMNVAHYAGMAGIGELQGAALGRPAIVVSAGPSLKRTIQHLKDPAVRERCVIVAVQTVLKQLLSEGIRPHFVCALDYHEVSRRFYEGLTAEDVQGVTLVAEPKANAAILDAFPGEKRLVGDEFLEELFAFDDSGAGFGGTHAPMKPGATVAHLAYYLARFLGADPVILTGQDLAFTDGQYYSAGAAIHDTWACELNAFNTLEMMEWQRIVRMRGNLHAMTDHLGRPVYSDDQMVAYLHQFERDFMEDDARGLTVIDATEGGVRKSHSVTMPMGEAIEMHVRHARPLGELGSPAGAMRADETGRIAALKERLKRVRSDVRTIARLSRETRDLLVKLAGRLNDAERSNAIIRQVHALRDRVESLRPAYALVHRINQAGTFKRFKADRAIRLEGELSPAEEQKKRCERDSMNVGWIADSADALEELLGASVASLDGAPKRTRDIAPKGDEENTPAAGAAPSVTVGAVVVFDSLDPIHLKHVRGTLERLAGAKVMRRVVIVTDDEAAARNAVGGTILGLDVHFMAASLDQWRERRGAVRSARAWAGTCWRGGIGGMTVFDEVYDPVLAADAMEREGLDGTLLIGAEWCAIDPGLTRQVVERFAEVHMAQPLAFTQAPPGLCGCVVSRELARDLAKGVESCSPLASIAGVLGYRPLNARADLIAQTGCVAIPASVRSTLARFVPDHGRWMGNMAGDSNGAAVDAEHACGAVRASMLRGSERWPTEVVIPVSSDGWWIDAGAIVRLLGAIDADAAAPALTIVGSAEFDAFLHPGIRTILEAAAGAKHGGRFTAVHLRTRLLAEPEKLAAILPLLAESVDVVSVDCVAGSAETHALLTGKGGFDRLMNNIDALLGARRARGGLLTPWIVPRITRRDAVYSEIEGFFDKSVLVAGWGVIDPLPAPIAGERIEPLPLPAAAKVREMLSVLEIDAEEVVRLGTAEALRGAWASTLRSRIAAIDADPRLRAVIQPGA